MGAPYVIGNWPYLHSKSTANFATTPPSIKESLSRFNFKPNTASKHLKKHLNNLIYLWELQKKIKVSSVNWRWDTVIQYKGKIQKINVEYLPMAQKNLNKGCASKLIQELNFNSKIAKKSDNRT